MEVEFLSNMRYSLLASAEQWKEWQLKLGKFGDYFERAMKAATPLPSPAASTQAMLTLPSPPISTESSPPALTTYSPNSAAYNYNNQWPSAYPPPLVSPLPSMAIVPELQHAARKRSYEETANEPPAKRVTRSNGSQITHQPTLPMSRPNLPRLPVPSLSVTTSQMGVYPAMTQNLPILPPLGGGRAMSTVYPSTPSWTPQSQGALTPTGQKNHSAIQGYNGQNYGTPSRRQSPLSVHGAISLNSSPISGNFPNYNLNSPSIFLQQRSSPYKPVRPPHALLGPASSGLMHNYPPNIDQMHYQPLGKRNDYRTGIVPEYASHPTYPHWPSLPQPNFQP
jgi:hypothetical protein